MGHIKLFSLHGINTVGAWQERLGPIFHAHFSYQPIKYKGHRSLWGLPQILFRVGFNKAQISVIDQYNKFTQGSVARKYLIAHSYGTVISANIMSRFPDIEFHKIIFLGSALNPKFNWNKIAGRRFELVNEYGSADLAVKFAKWIFWRPLLGDAGSIGFSSPNVHTVAQPFADCSDCSRDRRHNLHNVLLENFRHSDYFLSDGHAQSIWLPILWGYTPRAYKSFLDLCRHAAWHHESGAIEDLNIAEKELLALQLETGPNGSSQTLAEHISRYPDLNTRSRDFGLGESEVQEVYLLVIRGVWRLVSDALSHPSDTKKARYLWPPRAVRQSVSVVMRQRKNNRVRNSRQLKLEKRTHDE